MASVCLMLTSCSTIVCLHIWLSSMNVDSLENALCMREQREAAAAAEKKAANKKGKKS